MEIPITKLKMQINAINRLLDAGNTPQVKIDMETRVLGETLKEYNRAGSTAPSYEKEAVLNDLKALQKRLKIYELTGGTKA